ncbi:uncharacterized protein LOC108890106 isoform X3 [Lates calcarifer]|uniref:Uncharacterized protein LOC108890106 isoform X1 n=1 Tax=Lates calcarifer TaxID=8187 RepID=A0AAJ8DLC5_LATCA|nr:uncharacterized protein LOC108890106 isoform X1 [Lates calcarifer]XP_050923351.1 uncharacterized protein LOC108890106 isoform X2 [Lates calcarifer]XP_050923352.1 uncharacterized protein LOC108890106 isoform X3 [Lates calcarifer]
MMNFTMRTALLLCSLSWISVSVSESQTVKAQSGREVTLLCPKTIKDPAVTFWLRVVNRINMSCISVMSRSDSKAEYCDGYKTGNFEMSSNSSTVFLKIKRVNVSDSGQYFCGFYTDGRITFTEIQYLNLTSSNDEPHDVEDSKCKEESGVIKLTTVILGALSVLLVMVIIGLVVQNRKLQTADKEEQNPQQSETRVSDDVNYAAVTFQTKTKRRELETNVVYAATR